MIRLCCARERTKLLFNYANKFMIHSFLWFLLQLSVLLVLLIQLCLLIYTHRHQIPLRTALSELIGSNFLFILTVGELHCWLNSWLSWMVLFAERSRKGAGLGDASCLSQGENCFCSHNSHNISPFLACSSKGHKWRGGEWFRWRHLRVSMRVFLLCVKKCEILGSHIFNSTSGSDIGICYVFRSILALYYRHSLYLQVCNSYMMLNSSNSQSLSWLVTWFTVWVY